MLLLSERTWWPYQQRTSSSSSSCPPTAAGCTSHKVKGTVPQKRDSSDKSFIPRSIILVGVTNFGKYKNISKVLLEEEGIDIKFIRQSNKSMEV